MEKNKINFLPPLRRAKLETYKNPDIKVGDLRLIPANTPFSASSLQMDVYSDKDIIIKIIATFELNDCVYGIPQNIIFNYPGVFPMNVDRCNSEINISFAKTKPYKLPEPVFLTPVYINEENDSNDDYEKCPVCGENLIEKYSGVKCSKCDYFECI